MSILYFCVFPVLCQEFFAIFCLRLCGRRGAPNEKHSVAFPTAVGLPLSSFQHFQHSFQHFNIVKFYHNRVFQQFNNLSTNLST
nr:hypothetical protein DKQYCJNZ_DKQYCJNZ_CDS_0005 [Microvirus sp.]